MAQSLGQRGRLHLRVQPLESKTSHLNPRPSGVHGLLQHQVLATSPWTAFMYRHPDAQYAELGLGGKWGHLVVWLFGVEWTTAKMTLQVSEWHALCLTWKHTKDRPALYIDGKQVEIWSAHRSNTSYNNRKLAPNGTLTLGVSHCLVDGNINIISFTRLLGNLSQFRLWGQEQEVTSVRCTEGDLVKWERDNWDTQICAPLTDPSLQCEWSFYKVRLMFAIIRSDGNKTELYRARDIAHKWLRKVLPTSIYLPRVSVFEVPRSSTEDGLLNTTHVDGQMRWAPPNDRFYCLVHINVIPPLDVAAVQIEMHTNLRTPYYEPSSQLQLLTDPDSIHTTPVESFTATTVSTPDAETQPSVVTTVLPIITTRTTRSTTAAGLTAGPSSVSELYFEVKLNVSITGDWDPELVLSTWLNSSLPDHMMIVLDLQMLPKDRRYRARSVINSLSSCRESCVFQVQVMMSLSDTQEMEELIRFLLQMPYDNGSISVATEDIEISRILIYNCVEQSHLTRKGLFEWPTISGGKNTTQPCPKNPRHHATRHCKLSLKTHWMAPDLEDCSLLVETIPDLDHVKVTPDNALDIIDMIVSLLKNHSTLNYKELATVLNKLEDIVNLSVVTPALGQALIDIISDILESDSDLLPFTNTILNITEAVGDRMVGYDSSSTLLAPAIAVTVVDVLPGEFSSLTFGVSSYRLGKKPEIFINRYPLNGSVAFISLPSVLQDSFPQSGFNLSPARITFQFFGLPELFKTSQKGATLNTFVVSASVTNASSPIKDLVEDVKVTLQHLTPNKHHSEVQCVYWNFNKNHGHGGWDDHGCRKHYSSSDYTTCLCDHLTHFGVLLDPTRNPVDPANEQILTIITYIGCGVSSLFLGITVLTYTAFEKLRRDYPSQILINLSLALLGLNLAFLVNSWLSSWGIYGLCVAAASTLHYFLLASFTWMGLEAVNMYFALVKVFNVYVPSYILKFCALGWGIPLVICVMVLIVNREAYGGHLYNDAQSSLELLDSSDSFCWFQDDVTFYVSVVAYAVLIFLFNIAIFVVVLNQIRQMRANSPAGTRRGLIHDLRGVASLTLLLGLTWTVGFFTWGPARIVLLYIFSGLNSLQGLFIFFFHCLMKENVRRQWRIHLCFGRFRLEEHSEWSNSASLGAVAKPRSNPPRVSVPSVRSIKSSSTDSTSASSDSSRRELACKRPDLGFFVNSLALPRAQMSPSGTEALPHQLGTHPTPGWRNHLLG
ncbi:adhesion G-protein coupled receptor G4 [Xyrichtys novacula]|uniref:Adhesion G-protein coupled receptor G4 n=1 Tax=Xyrichtys novacula TaxID=13765 RepID=A0AAV1FT33_XYRNO|nr:adhesion G-protein coupled receptor G4 [Xyrichtys novacula]